MIARNKRFTTNLFDKTFKRCRRIKMGRYLFLVAPSKGAVHFSVVVGKKISKLAVERNRIRRQIYEIIRTEFQEKAGNWNIIFLYKDDKMFQDSENFKKSFHQLLITLNSSHTHHGKR